MKLFKTKQGIIIEREGQHYLLKDQSWNTFVNDDQLHSKMIEATKTATRLTVSDFSTQLKLLFFV